MTPIRLYKKNPHYLQFRRKPVVLVSSAEHYGSLINADFDYVKHLDTLASYGFNHARVFCSTYLEIPGAFGIADNTLAPRPENFVAAWQRSNAPGCAPGGNKFDLATWNEEYFSRLSDIAAQAGARNIALEIVLFSFLYNDELWAANPMNAANNVNGVGAVPRTKVYTLDNGTLLAAQEAVVRRTVEQLRDTDNVYFELINEPYSTSDGTDFDPWQRHMAQVIRDCEPTASRRHLIARNYANDSRMVLDHDRAVDILNFHYASAESVYANYLLNRPISFDETGFSGKDMSTYRHQAWKFMLAGGGIFSHLDYSFTVARPDGTHAVEDTTPGAGGHYLRKQLKVLKDFLESVPYWTMRPANHLQSGHEHNHIARIMSCEGTCYIGYVGRQFPGHTLHLFLPEGSWRTEWICPSDGAPLAVELFGHPGGPRKMEPPPFADDVAFRVEAQEPA
jgi:hypothetical protein